ncbi:hypothetical protein PYW07_002436 [Mythimna separata]|uniref:TLC domain-containing protein n=1 Tax=Mythimna separata TaxID=271217 RepID=A0AAD8DU52_MYTSE|nr:hypothetical protein PYW07_002436 [Mythimna separata]
MSLLRHPLSNASVFKLTSFLFWNWVYLMTVEQAKDRDPEWCSRVVTVLHGTVAVIIGYAQCNLPLTTQNLSRQLLPSQYILMIWSWGYFAFDLLWCLMYWSDSRVILFHHLAALLSITRYMHKERTGCTFSCTMVLMELTNPLLQARWFLKKMGHGNTLLYTVVEFMYLILFLFLRGIVGSIAMYWIMTSDFFDWEEKIMSGSLYVVSMIFIYDIAGYIRYKYKREITEFRREFLYATELKTHSERVAERLQAEAAALKAQAKKKAEREAAAAARAVERRIC